MKVLKDLACGCMVLDSAFWPVSAPPSSTASMFASLNHTRMSIWEALSQFSGLREYEAALFDPAGALLDPDMPLMQHALQSAELCRLNFPDKDWMHLVGLIHGLGKLLAHPM
ncbi:hypothetical protein DUNSADRAFT_7056 [Dunaliella salina]|uniref:Inositol oxygenase n=1 Tax=Dunaliella salina TaxID=3046 RepID=A0ABQ7H6I2_DUNSA|nr:hypothetical protein DUNSADRAFT_7056 [Dunaliella salina]|eukprot:KAF5842447.1 hypothetical protein DUNSADRAFT_7056 [Dunaliella salina]